MALLSRHGAVVKGGPEEAEKLLAALLEWKAAGSDPSVSAPSAPSRPAA
jgi:hypothetical protein